MRNTLAPIILSGVVLTFLTQEILAQTITQPTLPTHGFSFVYGTIINYQPSGFDWSNVSAFQNFNVEFVPADSTDFSDVFLNADFAQQYSSQTGVVNSTFYEYNSDYFGFWGGVDGASGTQVVHPQAVIYLPYPFAQGDVHEDQLTFEFTVGGVVTTRSFQIDMEGVEGGTLLLPNGLSFDNTLRVATRTLTTDSNATTASTLLTEGFQYWTQDMPLPVAQTYTYTEIMGGDSTFLFAGGEFLAGATVGFDLPNAIAFEAFPSPASHTLNVSGPAGSWVRVLDVQGRVVHRCQLRSGQESWDVSGWPVGMHFLHIEGTSITRRVLVTH